MKRLSEYIIEASLKTQITHNIKQLLNKARRMLGKDEKMYMPYIVLDCEPLNGINVLENKYVWQEMLTFFEKTQFVDKKVDTNEQLAYFSYTDLDNEDVEKMYQRACKELDYINNDLGTNNVVFEKLKLDKQAKGMQKAFTHDLYRIDKGENSDMTRKWKWYRIEMKSDENGDSEEMDKHDAIFLYPGIMLMQNKMF